jgi:plastocyanin
MAPALAALTVTVAVVASCGEDGGSATTGDDGGGSETVVAKVLEESQPGIPADPGQWMIEIEVDPDGRRAYTVQEAVAPPGNTNFQLKNPQSIGHDLTIEQVGQGSVATKIVREGSDWVRISLFAGEKYVFYCSVPGHRKAGMEGTLKVDQQLEGGDLEAF